MTFVLIAGLIAMVSAVVIGPKFIESLRSHNLGQQIREEGPSSHVVKQGTPTMGGLLILGAAVVPFLVFSDYTTQALVVLFITLGCGLIGFADDYLKVRRRRSLGLAGRWKMLLLVAITVGTAVLLHQGGALDTAVYIPLVGWNLGLGPFYYVFLFVVIAGTANSMNLTDGVDGLAAGTAAIALLTFLAMVVMIWIRSGDPGARSSVPLDLAILAAALIGGTIGFLWFNAFPAEVFMGDTGSMALGGALAGFSVVTGTEVLLLLIGGIFAIEALSVIIQVVSFKRTGRRVFLMAPIHHHFEMKAWSETKIMVRFWIVGAILGASGFAIFYRDFLQITG